VVSTEEVDDVVVLGASPDELAVDEPGVPELVVVVALELVLVDVPDG